MIPECPLCGSHGRALKGILFHDPSATVYVDGRAVEIRRQEYRALKAIHEAGTRGATPGRIVEALYATEADEPEWPEALVQALVCRIRRKLGGGRLQVETLRGEYGAAIRTRRYRALILK